MQPFVSPVVHRSRFPDMSLSKKFTWKWFVRLLKARMQAMKTLDYYLSLPYRMELVPDPDEGGFAVSFPDLPGCLSCGDTADAALQNALDAKKAWLEAAIESNVSIHEPGSLDDYSGQFKLRVPKSLHRSLAEISKREGVSMNQYCVYLLSKNVSLSSF